LIRKFRFKKIDRTIRVIAISIMKNSHTLQQVRGRGCFCILIQDTPLNALLEHNHRGAAKRFRPGEVDRNFLEAL